VIPLPRRGALTRCVESASPARVRRTAFGLVLATALPGCERGPLPTKTAPSSSVVDAGQGGPAASASAWGGPAAAIDLPAVPAPRWRREDGCARDWTPSSDPARDVAALGKLCAQGMAALLPEASMIRVRPGRTAEVPFTLAVPGTCLRAAAAGGPGGISLSLWSGQKPLANVSSFEPAVLAPPDGPVCVREAGPYRIALGVAPADAADAEVSIAVQVWQAASD